jgi:hypothetical protein
MAEAICSIRAVAVTAAAPAAVALAVGWEIKFGSWYLKYTIVFGLSLLPLTTLTMSISASA